MTISLDDAADAAGACAIGTAPLPARARFSTDTRTLVPGDVYVALRGATFDGHRFVRDALAAGASALVVSDETAVPAGVAALVVRDTTHAYLAFAAVARRALRARVVAITGSAGKTTTKHFIARILSRAQDGYVAATHANENNEIGVAKLLLGTPVDAAYVVVEFGARHYAEIEPLARAARPDVAVLTNIGDAHLEIFGSRERLADTKWGIFATGAHQVLPRELAGDRRARAAYAERTCFAVTSASQRDAPPDRDARVTIVGRDTLAIDAPGLRERVATHVTIDGDHNLRNAAAAAAAAFALGIEPAAIARALADLELPSGRYERIAIGPAALIYDAYNASMDGTLATLGSFANERATRRIAVLGSMAELGIDAAEMHARVGAAAARAGCAYVLCGGEYAADLARGARAAGAPGDRIVVLADNAAAIAWLRAHVEAGDLILLKASRRYGFETIVDGLRDMRANDGSPHA